MKNKNIIILILLSIGIILLSIGLKMLNSAAERWIPGVLIIISIIFLGISAKLFSDHYILKKYKIQKEDKMTKEEKDHENRVKNISSSRSNLIVSVLFVAVLIFLFFIKINYIILTVLIIASIYMQSCLSAFLYIHYDKKFKNKDNTKKSN